MVPLRQGSTVPDMLDGSASTRKERSGVQLRDRYRPFRRAASQSTDAYFLTRTYSCGTTLDQTFGKWVNPAATLQFTQWLENHFINGNALAARGQTASSCTSGYPQISRPSALQPISPITNLNGGSRGGRDRNGCGLRRARPYFAGTPAAARNRIFIHNRQPLARLRRRFVQLAVDPLFKV